MAYFPDVPKIPFEGPKTKNPLAFRHYNASEIVEGRSMTDWLRFSVCYWHTFRGTGNDPFGPGTAVFAPRPRHNARAFSLPSHADRCRSKNQTVPATVGLQHVEDRAVGKVSASCQQFEGQNILTTNEPKFFIGKLEFEFIT